MNRRPIATVCVLAGAVGILLISAYLALRQHSRYRACVIANQLIASTRIINPSATTSICGVRGFTWVLLVVGGVLAIVGGIMAITGHKNFGIA